MSSYINIYYKKTHFDLEKLEEMKYRFEKSRKKFLIYILQLFCCCCCCQNGLWFERIRLFMYGTKIKLVLQSNIDEMIHL